MRQYHLQLLFLLWGGILSFCISSIGVYGQEKQNFGNDAGIALVNKIRDDFALIHFHDDQNPKPQIILADHYQPAEANPKSNIIIMDKNVVKRFQNDPDTLAALMGHEYRHLFQKHLCYNDGCADRKKFQSACEEQIYGDHEQDADVYGIITMALAGYSPQKVTDIGKDFISQLSSRENQFREKRIWQFEQNFAKALETLDYVFLGVAALQNQDFHLAIGALKCFQGRLNYRIDFVNTLLGIAHLQKAVEDSPFIPFIPLWPQTTALDNLTQAGSQFRVSPEDLVQAKQYFARGSLNAPSVSQFYNQAWLEFIDHMSSFEKTNLFQINKLLNQSEKLCKDSKCNQLVKDTRNYIKCYSMGLPCNKERLKLRKNSVQSPSIPILIDLNLLNADHLMRVKIGNFHQNISVFYHKQKFIFKSDTQTYSLSHQDLDNKGVIYNLKKKVIRSLKGFLKG